jgi:hypothetical protein
MSAAQGRSDADNDDDDDDQDEDEDEAASTAKLINSQLNSSPTRRIIDKIQPKASVEATVEKVSDLRVESYEGETEEDREMIAEHKKYT